MFRLPLFLLCVGIVIGCGTETQSSFDSHIPSGAPPIVERVDPTSAAAGETVTLFGVGFSIIAAENILHIGETAVSATEYGVVDEPVGAEVEQLDFELPEELSAGDYDIFLSVLSTPSNADQSLTITP